jgi:hypothetical protein
LIRAASARFLLIRQIIFTFAMMASRAFFAG